MFGYNINSLKSEINSFEKLVKTFNRKNKNNKKAKVELNIIEEGLCSKIENMLIVNNSEINQVKKNKGNNIILKQKVRLAKCVISYDNSIMNFKNFLSSKFALFNSSKRLLFCKNNVLISLIILLLFLFPFLLLSTLLALLKFIFRKKTKSKKRKKRFNLNDLKNNNLDDKLYDIVDRYAKNKEDIKAIIDLIKAKISPIELEETLKKLKEDPLFKDLLNDLDYPKFLKELNELLEKQINEFKYIEPELYLEMKEKEQNKHLNFLTELKNMIVDKVVSKIKKNKNALKILLIEETNKVKVKIKKFKNKNIRFAHDFETLDVLKPIKNKIKIKKLKNKDKNFNKITEAYEVRVKKFKKNKNKIKKIKNIKNLDYDLINGIDEKFDKFLKDKKKKFKNKKKKLEKNREEKINDFKNAIKYLSSNSKSHDFSR